MVALDHDHCICNYERDHDHFLTRVSWPNIARAKGQKAAQGKRQRWLQGGTEIQHPPTGPFPSFNHTAASDVADSSDMYCP